MKNASSPPRFSLFLLFLCLRWTRFPEKWNGFCRLRNTFLSQVKRAPTRCYFRGLLTFSLGEKNLQSGVHETDFFLSGARKRKEKKGWGKQDVGGRSRAARRERETLAVSSVSDEQRRFHFSRFSSFSPSSLWFIFFFFASWHRSPSLPLLFPLPENGICETNLHILHSLPFFLSFSLSSSLIFSSLLVLSFPWPGA